jgi:hypothetical protein
VKNPLGFLNSANRLVLQNFKAPHGSEGFKVYEVLKGPPKPLQAEGLGKQNLQFGELTMAKPNFDSIDSSRKATPRQISAIANRFAKLTNPEDSWMLTKKYTAVLYRFQKESGKDLTHGEIQKFFKARKVPKNFTDLLTTAETPKESQKTSTKSSKPSTKAPTKKSSPKPKASDETSELEALKAQMAELQATVAFIAKKIS